MNKEKASEKTLFSFMYLLAGISSYIAPINSNQTI